MKGKLGAGPDRRALARLLGPAGQILEAVMTLNTRMPLALTLALTLGVTAAAEAQDKKAPSRRFAIGEIKIEGQIQKPQAFYILQRSSLNFEGLELKNSFLPKIIKSVEQPPF